MLRHFLLGLVLCTSAVLAHADVIAATQGTAPTTSKFRYVSGGLWWYHSDADVLCKTKVASGYGSDKTGWHAFDITASGAKCAPTTGLPYQGWAVTFDKGNTCVPDGGNSSQSCTIYTCPAGYDGPKTVNGQPNMCEQQNPCASKAGQDRFYWQSFNGAAPTGVFCEGGCELYKTGPVSHPSMNPDGETYIGGTAEKHWLMKDQYTGGACTTGQPTYGDQGKHEDTVKPPYPPKKPTCGATEGVLTTSTGKVHCIPEGNPNTSKPKVEKEVKKDTFQDGSTKTTETTKTTDTTTGASHTSTSTTVVAGPTGGTEAGTPGTSTGSVEDSGDGDGEGGEGQCAKEPDSPMCRKGELKEKGEFGSLDGEIAGAKELLRTTFEGIRMEASEAVQAGLPQGGGSLPCYPPIEVLGSSLSLCFSRYESQLGIVGLFVLLLASLGSVFIILRR